MTENPFAIELTDVTKRYANTLATDSISFRVKETEFFGLLGPNGAGKTTTINMMASILKPTEGSIRILGIDVKNQPVEVKKIIGLVFQDSALDRQLTVRENLIFAGMLHGLKKDLIEKRLIELLTLFGLEDKKDKPVGALSGGQRRGVDIARGVIHQPRVLFLDEPTIGLDVSARVRIWRFIHKLRKSDGITIVLTTHYLEEAESCDNVCFIDEGKIVLAGKPDILIKEFNAEILEIESSDIDGLYPSLRSFLGEGRVDFKTAYFKVAKNEEIFVSQKIDQIKNEFSSRVTRVSIRPINLNDVFLWINT